MSTKALLIVWTIFAGAALARSQSPLAWQFDNTDFVVQPTDSILLTGTITNASDAPYVIPFGPDPQGVSAFWTGNLNPNYTFSQQLEILGDTVPAHGILQFDFGALTPTEGYAQPGEYQPGGVDIPSAGAIDFGGGLQYSDNTFEVTVVPEPGIMAFLAAGGGMAGLLLKRRNLI